MRLIDSAACTGYIEGYYGRLFSWHERAGIVSQLSRLNMSNYFYAPKEDTYHRLQWREAYPIEWREHFSAFASHAHKHSVQIIAGIAPGLDFNFQHIDQGADFVSLVKKAAQLLADGANGVALLMDDINTEFDKSGTEFESEGEAHAVLANALSDAIGQKLFIVPRVYANELEHESPGYAKAFSEKLSAGHCIFHCGSHIVAPSIETDSLAALSQYDQHRLIVWDNLYANDYCPRRLFVGPWVGREDLAEVMLNPTGMPFTDALLLDLVSVANNQPSDDSHLAVLARHGVPEAFQMIEAYFRHPLGIGTPEFIGTDIGNEADNASNIGTTTQEQYNAIEFLLWKWKSPLAREWYPYIFGLKHDLLMANNQLADIRIRKTQTVPLADWLVHNLKHS